jgi:hypothetical protein
MEATRVVFDLLKRTMLFGYQMQYKRDGRRK